MHHHDCTLPDNESEACAYVLNDSDACEGGGYFQYTHLVVCHPQIVGLSVSVTLLFLTQLFLGLGVAADSFFCPALAVIVKQLKISDNIAGVTFLAFGNGAPDIFSSFASVLSSKHPKPGLAFGSLLGAGMYTSTVIVATVTLLGPFDVMRRPLIRDLLFYISAVVWMTIILASGLIVFWHALAFILLYLIYTTVVFGGRFIQLRRLKQKQQQGSKRPSMSESPRQSVSVVNLRDEVPQKSPKLARPDSIIEEGTWTYDVFHHQGGFEHSPMPENVRRRKLSESLTTDTNNSTDLLLLEDPMWLDLWKCIRPVSLESWREAAWYTRTVMVVRAPLLLLLKMTIPLVDPEMPRENWCKPLLMLHCILSPLVPMFLFKKHLMLLGGVFPLWLLLMLIGIILAIIVKKTTHKNQPPRFHRLLSYLGFLMAIFWIYMMAREVVGIVTMLGALGGISQDLLGVTVLAWSNSLGDFVSDVTVARQGFPRMAISACLGGPLFNLLFGFGIPFTIITLRLGTGIAVLFSGVRKVLVGFLGLSLCSSLLFIPLSGFRATRLYASFLLFVYVTFLTMIILADRGVIDF